MFCLGEVKVVGDGLSRNAAEGDEVRERFENQTDMPRTLMEAFDMARVSSCSMIDDGEEVVQGRCLFDDGEPQASLHVLNPPGACPVRICPSRTPSGLVKVIAVFAPSHSETDEDLDAYMRYEVEGYGCILLNEVVVTPPLVSPRGARKWLGKYVQPPVSKQDNTRMRLTALDGILAFARTLQSGMLTAVMARGKAALVAIALMSQECRDAACKERHVSAKEMTELEGIVSALSHNVLLAPMRFPCKHYLATWRDYMPEATCVCPSNNTTSVFVVVPEHDAAQDHVRLIARTLMGAVAVELKFPGPACRSAPKEFKLELLRTTPSFLKDSGNKHSVIVQGCALKRSREKRGSRQRWPE
jgi:hypothetical protein